MNPFEFVLAIMILIFGFSLIRHKMGAPDRSKRDLMREPEDSAETLRLREEVKELKERVKVLERITVEKENSLSRQIDDLRDR